MRAYILLPVLLAAGCQTGGFFNPDEGERRTLRLFRASPARVEITPQAIGKKTNEEHLVIVSVYDEDGHALGRRAVEWTLEGPGKIIAADSGSLFVRGQRDPDGKSAVSSTNSHEKTLGRKTKDTNDDTRIKAGQTWVVVTSAVEGQTVLTAVCPDVADRSKGRAVAKILWANSEFTFPAAATVKVGGEVALSTSINQLANTAAPGTLRVRYRIMGGAPASLISETSTAALSGTNPQEAVATADISGSAGVRISQPNPVPGRTKVAIEIFKADPNGVNAGQVLARSETMVDWTAAKLTLDCMAPPAGAQGRELTYTLRVANSGTVESPAVVLRAPVPDGVELISVNPQPSVRNGRELVWSVGALAGGANREFTLTVKPTQQGTLTFRTSADTADGQRAETSAKVNVGTAGLKVAIDAPNGLGTGENAMARVLVRNVGTVAAENATVWVTGGVLAANTPTEHPVGTIAPGSTRTVEVPLRAAASGRFALRATVTADGGLTDKSETALDVKKAGLIVEVRGPSKVATGEDATYEIGLVNTGEETLSNIKLSAELPTGFRATGTGAAAGRFQTTVASLPPNGRRVVPFTVLADQPMDSVGIVAKATTSPTAQRTLEATGMATVSAFALPVLTLELTGPQRPVPQESTARYRVVVRNRGTSATAGVSATVEFPEELPPLRASEGVRIDGRTATYTLSRALNAGESVTFYVEARAGARGTSTVRASVNAPMLDHPLKDEQATRVVQP
jgi:uncharacterized repeat protein (TIGR01451 family)